jgi:hypothetical protein
MEPSTFKQRVVKEGTYIYASSVECELRVVFSPVRFGSGDAEDDSQEREDVAVDTYYVQWGSTTEHGMFVAGGGGFASLEEAVAAAESALGVGHSVRWRS